MRWCTSAKVSILSISLGATLCGSALAQPERPPVHTPERRSEYTRRIQDFWKDLDIDPKSSPEKLRLLLAGQGLSGPVGPGPNIAISATSPRAAEIALTALMALKRKGYWKGSVHALGDGSPSIALVVGVTEQLHGPVMTVHKPFLSSLEVVDVRVAPPNVNHSLFFTELTLASQLFKGSEDFDFKLEKLRPDQAKYSLKCYDKETHIVFLDQLKDFLLQDEGNGRHAEFKLSKSFLEGLPQRSSAMRIRDLLSSHWPELWSESAPLDFFEPGQPAAPEGAEMVNLWISPEIDGPEAAEKVFYSVLELLDSSPQP